MRQEMLDLNLCRDKKWGENQDWLEDGKCIHCSDDELEGRGKWNSNKDGNWAYDIGDVCQVDCTREECIGMGLWNWSEIAITAARNIAAAAARDNAIAAARNIAAAAARDNAGFSATEKKAADAAHLKLLKSGFTSVSDTETKIEKIAAHAKTIAGIPLWAYDHCRDSRVRTTDEGLFCTFTYKEYYNSLDPQLKRLKIIADLLKNRSVIQPPFKEAPKAHWVISGSWAGKSTGYKLEMEHWAKNQSVMCLEDEKVSDPFKGLSIGTTCCNGTHGQRLKTHCPKGTFEGAKRKCEDEQMRLCTFYELQSGFGEGTGCNFDKHLIWSEEPCWFQKDELIDLSNPHR